MKPELDLTTDDGLRAACEAVQKTDYWRSRVDDWISPMAECIEKVRGAEESERASREFQHELWEKNRVSSVGMGDISVEAALDDTEFRGWLAKQSLDPLPEDESDRIDALNALYDQLVQRVAPSSRVPHLKILRVLAVLYPGRLTTITNRGDLKRLYRAMGGPSVVQGAIEKNTWILRRFEAALGKVAPDSHSVAQRIALPWQVYANYVMPPKDGAAATTAETDPTELNLDPHPIARRRRGLMGIKGGIPTIQSVLQFARDGVTREELVEHIRAEIPTYNDASLKQVANAMRTDFGVLTVQDGRYLPTERGLALLESGDPTDISDWLLTRVIGVDNVLVELRDRGTLSMPELSQHLREVNPGWTTSYGPSALLRWLKAFALIEVDGNKQARLTDLGREWAARIHWKPEMLPRDPDETLRVVPEPRERADLVSVLPAFESIIERVCSDKKFDPSLVAKLHIGLWAHERRHLAILTGLSGSGKTLLARTYARALIEQDAYEASQLCIVRVQPGWYDPAPLLGYVNPLQPDTFEQTDFLKFLLRASSDPEQPYVAILDEMNLSHPEQYMAPLLSAMETDEVLSIHAREELLDGVPSSIEYPRNLALIGTVNMDETTHGLSDKVLDRAFTMEFWDIDVDQYPDWDKRSIEPRDKDRVRSLLRALVKALSPARLHFGWRVINDVLNFVALSAKAGSHLPFEIALDSVIYAKVLPKLRGDDSQRVKDALDACATALHEHGLERSHQKVKDMIGDLRSLGSTRFWR